MVIRDFGLIKKSEYAIRIIFAQFIVVVEWSETNFN
jgi:hypothetical protein